MSPIHLTQSETNRVHISMNENDSSGKSALGILHSDFQ